MEDEIINDKNEIIYKILIFLGGGGFGEVYLAGKINNLTEKYAVKVLKKKMKNLKKKLKLLKELEK